MFSPLDDDGTKPIKSWIPYIVGMTVTAVLSAIGADLAKLGIDELKNKWGSKPPKETKKRKP